MTEYGLTDEVARILRRLADDGMLKHDEVRRLTPIAALVAAEIMFSAAPGDDDDGPPSMGGRNGAAPFAREGNDWVFRRPDFG